MKTLFRTVPVNRTDHRYDVATGDKLVRSAVSQRARVRVRVMLARFKVSNSAHGGQTVNVIGQYV